MPSLVECKRSKVLALARRFGLKPPKKSKVAVRKLAKTDNYYNARNFRMETFEKSIFNDGKAKKLVTRADAKLWPLRDECVFRIWEDEPWYLRGGGRDKINNRNSKWRAWMHYCRLKLPHCFFEIDSIDTDAKAERFRRKHPNVTWTQLQKFGEFLADAEYRNPSHYVSAVGQRLRSINALDRYNPLSCCLMKQTFQRLNKLASDFSQKRAVPPNTAKMNLLTAREKMTFATWQQSGLRPKSMLELRRDMVYEEQDSAFVRIIVPVVKVDPEPGEFFAVWIPKDCFDINTLPFTCQDLHSIAGKLGTTTYGVRRALAIWLRLLLMNLGIEPKIQDANHGKAHKFSVGACAKWVANPKFEMFKTKVCAHLGWSKNSTTWEDVYSSDALQYLNTEFAISPLMRSWFCKNLY